MIKKKVSNKGKSVKVTFELPADLVQESASVVGSFNDWDPEADVMTFVKTRKVWKKEISFDAGETVKFRYFIDGAWKNEKEFDDELPFDEDADIDVVLTETLALTNHALTSLRNTKEALEKTELILDEISADYQK